MATDKQQHLEEKEQMMQCTLPLKGTTLRSKTRVYSLAKVLGAGGFGITYLVSSEIMVGSIPQRLFFVIKEHFLKGCYRGTNGMEVLCAPTLKKEFDQSKSDFITEAERLNKLGNMSPNIVKVNEHFEANGTAYYVMEYLDGGDLYNYVRKHGALSEGMAFSIITPIANAVSHLHNAGLLHLDIKPDNIVMKRDDTTGSFIPVLIDFGIAKHFDKSGKPTSKLVAKGASEGYAPMEQYTEITRFAPEIDVYALGATLFYCLTGQNPPKAFDITSISEITSKIPDAVGQKVRNAIAKAMQRNGFDRTPNMKAFLADIEDRYTLPIGYVLHGKKINYRIVEIVGETTNFIKYKAVLSNSLKDTSSSQRTGNETPVLTRYYVYEYFIKGLYKRIDGICIDDKQSYYVPKNPADSHIMVEMPVDFPKKLLLEESNAQLPKAETFHANNTLYYTCIIMPKPSIWKIVVSVLMKSVAAAIGFIKKYIKHIAVMVVLAILFILGNKGVDMYQSYLKEQAIKDSIEQLRQDLINKEQAKADSVAKEKINAKLEEKNVSNAEEQTQVEQKEEDAVKNNEEKKSPKRKTDDELFAEAKFQSDYKKLADKGYKKAYYPLALSYYKSGNLSEAKKWAQKAVSSKMDLKKAKSLVSDIDNDLLFQKASNIIDYRRLAEKKYVKAYAPLAQREYEAGNYDEAAHYANLAIKAKVGTKTAEAVLEKLKRMGY